jgi:Ca2+-binding EF-hand superfamily protein
MLDTAELKVRIEALAKRVDLDGDGQIDAVEGGIFIKAVSTVKSLSDSGRAIASKFAGEQMTTPSPIPRSELIDAVMSMMEGKDEECVGELERNFEYMCCDLPPPPKKMSLDDVNAKMTALVSKIDLDGNGTIDAEELGAFLNGFISMINYVTEMNDNAMWAKKATYFPAEMDAAGMVAEMTKDGPIPCDQFVSRLLAMQDTPAQVDKEFVKFFEMAVQEGLTEFKKPSDDKIRARIMKLVSVIDKDGNGTVDEGEMKAFMISFNAHMVERGVMDGGMTADSFELTNFKDMTLAALVDDLMDDVGAIGAPYLQELESAISTGADAINA